MSEIKVAFICVHNSCRSQIAEAFGRHLASDVFQSYSAGTETKPQINQDAVRIMKELYNIDMEADGQFSKLVSDIPNPDIAISMGCNVGCPFIGRPFDDNWGLEDPTGKSDESEFCSCRRRPEEIYRNCYKKEYYGILLRKIKKFTGRLLTCSRMICYILTVCRTMRFKFCKTDTVIGE